METCDHDNSHFASLLPVSSSGSAIIIPITSSALAHQADRRHATASPLWIRRLGHRLEPANSKPWKSRRGLENGPALGTSLLLLNPDTYLGTSFK